MKWKKQWDITKFGVKQVFPNVWLGTSIETQEAFEARAYHLQELKQQGWKTFYSCEPLLEPLSLNLDMMPVDLVITGYESGHNARKPIGGNMLGNGKECQ